MTIKLCYYSVQIKLKKKLKRELKRLREREREITGLYIDQKGLF